MSALTRTSIILLITLLTLLTPILALPPPSSPSSSSVSTPSNLLSTRALPPVPITCSSTPIAVELAHHNGLYYIIKNQERNWTLAAGECKEFVNKSARSKACGIDAPGKISSQEWCERYSDIGDRCFTGGKNKWGFSGSSAGVRVTVEKNPAYQA